MSWSILSNSILNNSTLSNSLKKEMLVNEQTSSVVEPSFKTLSQELASKKKGNEGKGEEAVIDLQQIWAGLASFWFPSHPELLSYKVCWSNRKQKRTLASCNIDRQKVVVARELNYPNCIQWLDPLLYHEMCHAVLGRSIYKKNGRSPWHGREFRELESRHPGIVALNIWIKSRGWEKAVRSDRAKRRFLSPLRFFPRLSRIA